MKSKKCRACGKEFIPAMYKQSAEYCNDPECQKAKLKSSRRHFKSKTELKETDESNHKVYRQFKEKMSSGRVCRKCGKDPYPNYFYCPICHKSVQLDDEYEDVGNKI